MANFDKFFPVIVKMESPAYTNDPNDRGGPTKYGITLKTWQTYGYDKDGDGKITASDVKMLTQEDARKLYKKVFWDAFEADLISNQSLAELIVDWGLNSGPGVPAARLRKFLALPDKARIKAEVINKADSAVLFEKLKQARISFIEAIVKNDPKQKEYYNGWINRLSNFRFSAGDTGTAVAGIALCLLCWYAVRQLTVAN